MRKEKNRTREEGENPERMCQGTMLYEERFSDLDAAVTDVQAHFQQRIESSSSAEDALCRLQLAVHEWMANLVRHACFGERTPDVHLHIWKQKGRFRCTIEDNSDGFDFDMQLKQQAQDTAASLPERGMGLLLLKASTERAEYVPLEERLNRLHLSVNGSTDDGGAADDTARDG